MGFYRPVWGYLALTGVFQGIYFAGLSGAYRSGELSVAYPLARAFPVLMVAALTRLLASGKPLGPWAVAGMALIVVGCLALPMRRFSDFRLNTYRMTAQHWRDPRKSFELSRRAALSGAVFAKSKGGEAVSCPARGLLRHRLVLSCEGTPRHDSHWVAAGSRAMLYWTRQ